MTREWDEVAEVGAVPLREVSALAVLRTDGRTRLLAVGDHTPEIAVAEVGTDGVLGDGGELGWTTVDPRTFSGPQEHAPDAQLEGVACDSAGVVVLLAEEPSRLYVVDIDRRRLLTSVRLDVSPFADLAQAWDADPSSRGEGLLLLREGHVVIAKEKHPPGLVELAPEGAAALGVSADSLLGDRAFEVPEPGRLVAVAWWPWPTDAGLDDLSDLAPGPAAGVHLLSDQSAGLALLRLPLEPGDRPGADRVVDLPRKLLHKGKPEGLAVLADGTVLVACDVKKAGRALLRLTPPS